MAEIDKTLPNIKRPEDIEEESPEEIIEVVAPTEDIEEESPEEDIVNCLYVQEKQTTICEIDPAKIKILIEKSKEESQTIPESSQSNL